jgi:hypothetical protein
LTHRGGVEGHRLHAPDAGTRARCGVQGAQPGAHLAGRTLGECHRQHLPGGHVAAGDELRDPVGDGAGLARPGAREHTDRSAGSQHRFVLLVVQPGDQGVSEHRHGVHTGRGGRQTWCVATPFPPAASWNASLGRYVNQS